METFKLVLLICCTLFANKVPIGRDFSLSSFYSYSFEHNQSLKINGDQIRGSIYSDNCLEQCEPPKLYSFKNELGHIDFGLIGGFEIRDIEPYHESMDLGIHFDGQLDSLYFFLDARTYGNYIPGRTSPYSYDGEFIEVDNTSQESLHENLTFARFRTRIEYHSKIGHFFAGRDNVHWGPALYTNFMFHQDAVPFNQFGWKLAFGPFQIMTLSGRLFNTDTSGDFLNSDDYKTIYAHRYEIHFSKWAILSLNEQLIIKNGNDPLAFIPFVPLFMEKGQGKEEDNNGNLSVDFSIYPMKDLHLYTEFFLDDLEDPAKIFDDHWKSKWAWSLGFHYSKEFTLNQKPIRFGNITEYSRVEPWVYTHHRDNSAQSTHRAKVLGNQFGPHSQDIISKVYSRWNHLYFGLKNHWQWRGKSEGSQPYDVFDYETSNYQKDFLKNSSFNFKSELQLAFNWRYFGTQFCTELAEPLNSKFRIHFSY